MFAELMCVAAIATSPSDQDPRSVPPIADVVEQDGQLIGLGPRYRIEFGTGSVRFVPALGSQAPRTSSATFELTSIRRGDAVVWSPGAAGAHAVATPSPTGRVVVYARGRGITERYDVRPDGVEQSFVFGARPPGSGDLVVRGRIQTDLAADLPAEDGSLAFSSTWGGVSFGAVTGIDADGRTARGAIHARDGHLELSLPGAFVDSAAYPMTLDPLIGTVGTVVGGSANDTEVDVAYNTTRDTYLLVWRHDYSLVRSSIRAQLMRSDGSTVGSIMLVSTGSGVSTTPSVANVRDRHRFVVVWQDKPSYIGLSRILCRTIDPGTGAASNVVTVAQDPSDDLTEPSVGGGDTMALVAWSHSGVTRSVSAKTITVPRSGDPSALSAALNLTGPFQSGQMPCVSKSPTNGDINGVAWRADSGIEMAVVRKGGQPQIAAGPFQVTSFGVDPTIDGDGVRYYVAYDIPRTTIWTDRSVFCRRLAYDALAGTIIPHGGEVGIDVRVGVDQRNPSIACLGNRVFVAWAQAVGHLDYRIQLRALDPSTLANCGPPMTFGPAGRYNAAPAIATGDPPVSWDHGLVAFTSMEFNGMSIHGDVLFQRFESFRGGPVRDLGGGCGLGGTNTAGGDPAIGNSDFRVDLSGASTFATVAVANVAISPATPIQCGSCMITPPLVSFPATIVNGACSVTIPIPCVQGLIGGQLQSQWVTVGHPTAPCVILPTASFSNRVEITLDW